MSNAKAYDAAFATFFQRLALDGITPANTLFVIGTEENHHFAGANVGRASTPTPATCDGVTTACNYAHNQVAELSANLPGLLATQRANTTQFDVEPQGAAIYVHGQPAFNDPGVRQLERDTAALVNSHNPYSGVDNEAIVNYQAGAAEQRILHIETAGRVVTELLEKTPSALAPTRDLGACYKQLNASVGQFGTNTLLADTAALASGSPTDDRLFTTTETALRGLGRARDALATAIKTTLTRAAFQGVTPNRVAVAVEQTSCRLLLSASALLANRRP